MSLPEIRCGHCGRKLAEGHVLVLSIKCPRCRVLNHYQATSHSPAHQGVPDRTPTDAQPTHHSLVGR
ncbi:Com family DNA-binding transcriptional regulator [Aquitalea palustris]|uniref:Com family DNA-binding transcriptional regulator n=1 Tax=Aquitalea palustris TaxID=2480983 RepID=A0A454JKR1_9NEIS|nr:Com family DNA-binding transcriptional regulator [Aquitalea palustris]RMC99892.1 Com family DNA-binding transcriptional regulator [Aquitalea palustris]